MEIQSYVARIVQDTSARFLNAHDEQLRRYDEILRAIDELPSPQKEETLVRLLMEGNPNGLGIHFTPRLPGSSGAMP